MVLIIFGLSTNIQVNGSAITSLSATPKGVSSYRLLNFLHSKLCFRIILLLILDGLQVSFALGLMYA